MRKKLPITNYQLPITFGQLGQSLVEVLIAIVVVSLVLTTILAAIIMAVRSTQFSKHKSQATFLAQEAVEWLRSERRQLGWGNFLEYASSGGSVYCLSELVLTNPGDCATEIVKQLYLRSTRLTFNANRNEVKAEVTVRWSEGAKQFSTSVETTFSQWELQSN